VAGLELRPAAWPTTRRGVVGTHLLADVAAEDPFADLRPKRLGDRATVLDREIRDAAFSGQMVGLVQRVGGAGVDAQPARATVPRDRGVKLQLHGEHPQWNRALPPTLDFHRIFLRGHDHRQIATDTTLDKAVQFRLGVIMMIDVALGEIDMRPEFLQRVLEAFGCRDRAERTDERVLQSVER